MSLEYFYMLPIAIIIATIAMSTLVGGATFFSPLFILVLGLEPHVAIAVALMSQFFGFSTGLIRYIKLKTIDYSMGIYLLFITIPYAIIGAYLSSKLNPFLIRILLGIMVIYIGFNLLKHNTIDVKKNGKTIRSFNLELYKRDSKTLQLNQKEMKKTIFQTSLGSLFLGITSAGLGEVLGFNWIKKTNANLTTIVSTTVFIIAITTFVTSLTHMYSLFTTNIEGLKKSIDILIFTIPGVIIGAIIGTHIIKKINPQVLQKVISTILILTGFICFIPF